MPNSLELNRKCWNCGKPLMKISHAEVKTADGQHTLLVHKTCAEATRDYVKPGLTARPDDGVRHPWSDNA